MSEEWLDQGGLDRFLELLTLLGEVPTDTLAKKAREMFPGLVDDPAQRATFREHLRFVAATRRRVLTTPEGVAELNMLARASFVVEVEGETVGEHGPTPERTVEDVLSESEVELKAADAADALAAAFEEHQP